MSTKQGTCTTRVNYNLGTMYATNHHASYHRVQYVKNKEKICLQEPAWRVGPEATQVPMAQDKAFRIAAESIRRTKV